MKDQIVTFKTAELAKEVGFNKTVKGIYYGAKRAYDDFTYHRNNIKSTWVSAPTQSLLQKWLREKHNQHIAIIKTTAGYCGIDRDKFTGNPSWMYKSKFKTYEKALESELLECLNKIRLGAG